VRRGVAEAGSANARRTTLLNLFCSLSLSLFHSLSLSLPLSLSLSLTLSLPLYHSICLYHSLSLFSLSFLSLTASISFPFSSLSLSHCLTIAPVKKDMLTLYIDEGLWREHGHSEAINGKWQRQNVPIKGLCNKGSNAQP